VESSRQSSWNQLIFT